MQKELLQKLFADAGFETPRVLKDLKNAKDFYFEAIGQVKMDQRSQGRVALVGDASYCPSPITGMGTTLARVGAYILAGELGRNQDHKEAFKKYETLMRPYVTKAQKIFPETHMGIRFRNAALSFVARPTVMRLIEKLVKSKTDDTISLPDYETILA
ncbi:unnamed protein product, partial [Adineta steineri]